MNYMCLVVNFRKTRENFWVKINIYELKYQFFFSSWFPMKKSLTNHEN